MFRIIIFITSLDINSNSYFVTYFNCYCRLIIIIINSIFKIHFNNTTKIKQFDYLYLSKSYLVIIIVNLNNKNSILINFMKSIMLNFMLLLILHSTLFAVELIKGD